MEGFMPDWMKNSKFLYFLKSLFKRVTEDDSLAFAYQLTYSLLLAFFPFLIFLLTLVGYSSIDSTEILTRMQSMLPAEVYDLTAGIVTDVVDQQRGGLLGLSVFLAIYSSSGGFRAFMKGTNKAMDMDDKRNILLKYLSSIIWVILFAVTIIMALLGIVFGNQIISLIASYFPSIPLEGIVQILRFALPISMIFVLFVLFYMFVPAKNVRVRYAFPGALFATIGWLLATFAFQIYVNNFSNYSRFYGSLGAVVALMLWLLITSIIMLLAAEINALLIELKKAEDPYFTILKTRKAKKELEKDEVKIAEKKVERLEARKQEEIEKKIEKGEATIEDKVIAKENSIVHKETAIERRKEMKDQPEEETENHRKGQETKKTADSSVSPPQRKSDLESRRRALEERRSRLDDREDEER
ncbi:MAG TPA: YhjD/YihY/BrkB family envelope integrity protein [Clostridiaceae bacterium]|nr:YhjD/YihY/BrkB family envelope integrity protein [Clostridiaceae bacterium]